MPRSRFVCVSDFHGLREEKLEWAKPHERTILRWQASQLAGDQQ